MRTAWKWIIGIVVVLVILGVFVGGALALRSHFGAITRIVQVGPPNNQNPNTPNTPNTPNGGNPYYGQRPYGGTGPMPMMPYGRRGYPMMGGRGFGFGVLPILGIIGFLFALGFVVLLVLGIIWLVRSQARRTVVATTNTAGPIPSASNTIGTHACKNCGQTVQDGFAFCPNCGEKQ